MPAGNRVLAVDDNPTNLAVISESLQERVKLRLAESGAEALRIAPTFLPDVVLLDVQMPKPDGFEVCSRMKNDARLRHSQVIMVSARTNIDDRLRGYQAGADDYVTKPFDEDELCAKVDAALRTKNAYGLVQCDMETLRGATGDILELMTHLRDAETGEHLDRIRTYSQLLAGELREGPLADEIDDQFLDDLYKASALHDIGKIAIPDSILRKPQPLTADERIQMQQHTIIGARVLDHLAKQQSESTYFTMAAAIARWHHECVDGSGYPDGLLGNGIPLAARIVKVADVFDALTTERVYKPRYEPELAKEIIERGNGTEFDALVVGAMLQMFDEFSAVCNCGDLVEL